MKTKALKSGILIMVLIIYGFKFFGCPRNCGKDLFLDMLGNAKQAKEWELGDLRNLDSALFTVYNEKQEVVGAYYSNHSGMCALKFRINRLFDVKVSKKGWVTKIIKVDTRVPDEKLRKYSLPFEIDLFEDIPELDASVLKEPIAYVVFNNYLNCFDYNFVYTDEVNARLQKLYTDYYRLHAKYKPVKHNKTDLVKNNVADSLQAKDTLSLIKNSLSVSNNTPQKEENGVTEKSLFGGVGDPVSELRRILSDKSKGATFTASELSKINKTGQFNMVFKIQILSLCSHLPYEAKVFERGGKVNEYIFNEQYKYTVGEYKTLDNALNAMTELRKKGYYDAFIVAFFNGNRIATISNDLVLSDASLNK